MENLNNIERYNHLNKFLKEKFGERVLKICIDGNFTCPNRDGKVGFGGCIFCSEKGSGEHLKSIKKDKKPINENNDKFSISENNINQNFEDKNIDCTLKSIKLQVENYLNSYKSSRANKFIAYFQNFTNTYDSIENLKAKYDSALFDERIVGLAVATRPDCIDENVAKLLGEYSKKYFVIVELGLQTSNDETGKILNRGYSSNDFQKAVNLLKQFEIHIVCHIMVGLPNETIEDVKNTIKFVNSQKIDGLKIHSTYVVKNTKLEKMFLEKKYECLTLEKYIQSVCYIIAYLKKDIIIHRLSGDAPKDILIAPDWNAHKKWILNGIEKELKNQNIFQGCKLV